MPESPQRVLVVEDEAPIRDGLLSLLRAQGLAVSGAADGRAALEVLGQERFDLVVLDLMMPHVTGLEVLRHLRGRGEDVPVLVLTAKGSEEDVVSGLEAGADDYVTKPFGIRELVARAKGLLRRPRAEKPDDARIARRTGVIAEGCRATIDFDLHRVDDGATSITLTTREASLLEHLVTHRERIVTREELLVEVWGYRDGTIRTRTVDVHVQQLRAKLEKVKGGARWIATTRGKGYRFDAELA
ncbi:MAG: response regulator transcription factor [Sandaracinaceae bacterium]|nr:response regulator transcription factor [Sandaracinaceae bacterium]